MSLLFVFYLKQIQTTCFVFPSTNANKIHMFNKNKFFQKLEMGLAQKVNPWRPKYFFDLLKKSPRTTQKKNEGLLARPPKKNTRKTKPVFVHILFCQ